MEYSRHAVILAVNGPIAEALRVHRISRHVVAKRRWMKKSTIRSLG
jgi:hypothetical protein